MAKKATGTTKRAGAAKKPSAKKTASSAARKPSRAVGTTRARRGGGGDVSEGLIKLLQSPLVADLVAVAATAALAALAEYGFSNRGAGTGRKPGRAVKEAGKAAAAAIGRRLGTELDEIRKVSKAAKRA